MFMLKVKHEAIVSELEYTIAQRDFEITKLYFEKMSLHKELTLTQRLLMETAQLVKERSQVEQFTQEEIKTLISLCHPDKHNGKETATRITQKLLSIRNMKG